MTTLVFQSPTLRRGTFQLAIGAIAPRPGRITVLIGPNGGGKTTALRLAAGLLTPDTGAVLIDGEPVHALSAPQRAARIPAACALTSSRWKFDMNMTSKWLAASTGMAQPGK